MPGIDECLLKFWRLYRTPSAVNQDYIYIYISETGYIACSIEEHLHHLFIATSRLSTTFWHRPRPCRISNIGHWYWTSDIGPQSSDIGHQISCVGHQISDVGYRTSDIGDIGNRISGISDIRYRTSDIGRMISDIRECFFLTSSRLSKTFCHRPSARSSL